MPKTLVGTYASHADAMRVQHELERAGVPGASIQVHDGTRRASTEPLPEDRGIAGFVRRMLSGATGDLANIRKYEVHAEGGGTVVIVEGVSDQLVDAATAAMGTRGNVDVHDDASSEARAPDPGVDPATDANEILNTANGPERNVLPNAPSGWNTSRRGSPSTAGTIGHDPARPQGLTRDAQGLGTGAPRPAADQRTSAAAEPPPEGSAQGAPDALGHRVTGNAPGAGGAV